MINLCFNSDLQIQVHAILLKTTMRRFQENATTSQIRNGYVHEYSIETRQKWHFLKHVQVHLQDNLCTRRTHTVYIVCRLCVQTRAFCRLTEFEPLHFNMTQSAYISWIEYFRRSYYLQLMRRYRCAVRVMTIANAAAKLFSLTASAEL